MNSYNAATAVYAAAAAAAELHTKTLHMIYRLRCERLVVQEGARSIRAVPFPNKAFAGAVSDCAPLPLI